jgi:L-ascorbate metabolism protein UlaG (beta-lactamase superfamily)
MRILKWIGTLLLFAAVAFCLAPSVVPPFLDRIYYKGPKSDHFDGERFFNPGFSQYRGGNPRSFVNRVLNGGRAEWPEQVPVAQGVPPARVQGDEMRVTWIGHATVLVQTQGLNILTDPLWSQRASPFSFVGPKRVRQPGVAFDRLPKIDVVLISHNHYDHLDLATLKRLWQRDRPLIVTSLGNDTILRNEGVESRALDWGGEIAVRPGVAVRVDRNHHWSSRWGTDRNRALWSAFTLRLPSGDLFYAGDTGWGDGSWVREAAARGPYRLAIIPIGAYEPRDFMKNNHINPEEAVAMFEALQPTQALGIHWGTVQLTFEPIDEPRQKLEALKKARGIPPGRFIASEAGATFAVPPLSSSALPAPAGRPDRRTGQATSR